MSEFDPKIRTRTVEESLIVIEACADEFFYFPASNVDRRVNGAAWPELSVDTCTM